VGFAGEPSSQPSEPVFHANHTTGDRSAKPAHGNPVRAKTDQTDGNHSNPKDDGHASAKSSQAGPVNAQTKPTSGNELHQPGLKKAATAANDALMKNRIANHREQPAKLPVGSGTTASLPGVVRSRSASTAVVGGAAATNAKHSAAVVNGTDMRRKP
jgi:hypothetical protein